MSSAQADPVPDFMATGGPPAYALGGDCQRCGRIDLPLLLVTCSVVDKVNEPVILQSGHRHAAVLDPAFTALPRQASIPLTRLLSAGFVYVFYEKRGVWDIWQSFADGTLKKLLEHVDTQQYAAKREAAGVETSGTVCHRGAANLVAGLIGVTGVRTQPSVWLGYSRHLWTPHVLRSMTDDKHGARNKLMRKLAAQTWVAGGSDPGEGFLPLTESNLQAHVPEFHPGKPTAGTPLDPLLGACADAITCILPARMGQAAVMAEQVREVEKAAGTQGRALIACLPDFTGQVAEHNQLRNAEMERFSRFMHENERKRAVVDLIQTFKDIVHQQAEKGAGEKFDEVEADRAQFKRDHPAQPRVMYGVDGKVHFPAPPPEAPAEQRRLAYQQHIKRWSWSRYATYLNPDWENFEARYKSEFDRHVEKLSALAEDHVRALQRPEVELAMQHLFDPGSREDGRFYEAMTFLMLHGAGVGKPDKAWMEDQVKKLPTDPGAFFWRSMFGNQKDMIDHVIAAAASPKWDQLFSAMKNVLDLPPGKAEVPAILLAGGWEKLLVSMAGPLSKLLADTKSNAVLTRLWEGLVWARSGMVVVHQQFMLRNGLRSLAHFFEYSAWRMVETGLDLDGHNPFRGVRGTVPVPGYGDVLLSTLPKPKKTQKTLVHIVMAPQALEEAKGMSQAMVQLRRVTVEEAASTFSKVKRGVNLDAKLGGISLVFEILNYLSAQDAVEKADRFAEPEAKAGLTAAILGGLSAVSDVNAAWIKGVYGARWEGGSALGMKNVYGGLKIAGGLFGGMASLIGAYWSFVNAREKIKGRDLPMAALYGMAGTAGAVSGISTILSGSWSGFEAFRLLKVSAKTRVISLLLGTRAGLIGLVVALVILHFEDEPIAKWLERTIWGRKPLDQQYGDLREELKEIDKIVKAKPT